MLEGVPWRVPVSVEASLVGLLSLCSTRATRAPWRRSTTISEPTLVEARREIHAIATAAVVKPVILLLGHAAVGTVSEIAISTRPAPAEPGSVGPVWRTGLVVPEVSPSPVVGKSAATTPEPASLGTVKATAATPLSAFLATASPTVGLATLLVAGAIGRVTVTEVGNGRVFVITIGETASSTTAVASAASAATVAVIIPF